MTTRRTPIHCVFAVLALAGTLVAGCGGSDASKAGGSGAPITLRMGTEGSPGRPAADQIEEFARQVEKLSGGTMRIEPVFQAVNEGNGEWDQRVARMVAEGELDLATVSSRAWDTEGVTSLRALSAPFLVTSDELTDRIVTSELAAEMMAGLDKAGVVGLALLPEGMRHPFAFGEPLLSPSDYEGTLVRAHRSDVVYATFEALGARADDLPGEAGVQALADGSLAGAETSFVLAASLGVNTVATGNVTFFPRVNSFVVDADVFEGLDEGQRRILEEAAARTRTWAIETTPPDAEAAQAFCRQGGAVVLASEADLAALERATAPVYVDLERDAQTKSLIDAISALKAEIAVSAQATPVPCGEPDGVAETAPAEAAGQSIPNGVYRTEMTERELVEAGLRPSVADEYTGLHTITLADGDFIDELANDNYPFPDCLGTYSSSGSTVEFRFEVECHGTMTATWTLDDGSLRFTDIEGETDTALLQAVFGTKPFVRVSGSEP